MLRCVRSLVRTYFEGCGVVDDQLIEVVLAVDEACANAMRHSYRGEKDQRIRLGFRSNRKYIEVRLRDYGIPAPPDRVCRKEYVAPDRKTVQPGGRGVQILYEVFDDVVFRPGRERGNSVTMRLNRVRRIRG